MLKNEHLNWRWFFICWYLADQCCGVCCVFVCTGSKIKRDEPHDWQSGEVGHLYADRAAGIKPTQLLFCLSASTTDKKVREGKRGRLERGGVGGGISV